MKYFLSLYILILTTANFHSQDTLCEKIIIKSEIFAKNCLDQYFLQNKVNKEEFIASFENYFIDNKLVESTNKKGELYWNILKYIETHPDKMPTIKTPGYIMGVAKKLQLTIPKLIKYEQIACIRVSYKTYKSKCKNDNKSTLYVFGDIATALPENSDLHYSIIASTLRQFTTPTELDKTVYQENIVLLFWFQLSSFYGKWE
ncbi:MAG: hypothetical protein COA97_00340 [Flavobacteriales bacterium]|nr:MAG: hypothetical protein COA97_00340 [Flavobacteriales bacterium]